MGAMIKTGPSIPNHNFFAPKTLNIKFQNLYRQISLFNKIEIQILKIHLEKWCFIADSGILGFKMHSSQENYIEDTKTTFPLVLMEIPYRLALQDCSVTSLQFCS